LNQRAGAGLVACGPDPEMAAGVGRVRAWQGFAAGPPRPFCNQRRNGRKRPIYAPSLPCRRREV